MKWISTKPKNRLYRHDLRGLDSKFRARMRNQRQIKMIGGTLLSVLAITLLAWGTWFGIRNGLKQMFSENKFYQIKDIVVQSSGNTLKPDRILTDLRVQRGQNLLAVDLDDVRRELEFRPVVERAEVSRELPGRLLIRITERVPLANIVVGSKGPRYQIDRHGVIMDLSSYQKGSEDFRNRLVMLPTITGADIVSLKMGRVTSSREIFQALILIQKMEQMSFGSIFEINSIDVSRRGRLMVNTVDRVLVKMGVSEIDKQLKRLVLILDDARQRSMKVATVDLTLDHDAPVTFAATQ